MEVLATAALTEGEKNAAVAGALAGGALGFMAVFAFAIWIITIIASWKILEKAGEPGWKSLIPIYNYYMLYKIVGMSGWFWGLIVFCVIATILMGVDGISNMTPDQFENFNASQHVLGLVTMVIYMIVLLVADILYCIRTSKAFGHGGWFAAGLFFFMPIFWLVLGYGKSKYNKKAALK